MGIPYAIAPLLFMAGSVFAVSKTSPSSISQPGEKFIVTRFGTFFPEPHGRGTVGILLSCTATFFFCIWTAMHPNVITYRSPKHDTVYKAIFAFLSVLIPEGVMISAYGQFMQALELREVWKKHIDKEYHNHFGMDAAFFVVMGGYIIDEFPQNGFDGSWTRSQTSLPNIPGDEGAPQGAPTKVDEEKRPSVVLTPVVQPSTPTKCEHYESENFEPYRATLTPVGFKKLVEKGLIHEQNLQTTSIKDKGNASLITKLLAGSQAAWLFIGCLSRWAVDMPVTLVEIHVSIQVLCAVATYSFWWYKPLDIKDPIRIYARERNTTEVLYLFNDSKAVVQRERKYNQRPKLMTEYYYTTKYPYQNGIGLMVQVFYDIMTHIDPSTGSVGKMVLEGFLVCFVGALHLAAWNVHFPTPLERLLWLLSTLGMIVFPLLVVLVVSCTKYHESLIAVIWEQSFEVLCVSCYFKDSIKAVVRIGKVHAERVKYCDDDSQVQPVSWIRYCWQYLLIAFCLLCLLGYACSVLYITVESYLSMRNPSKDAFGTPRWSDYYPHW